MINDPNLRQTTIDLLELVQTVSGYPVVVEPNRQLTTTAALRMARGPQAIHRIEYNPDLAAEPDYYVAVQCGQVLRFFAPGERMDLAYSEQGMTAVRDLVQKDMGGRLGDMGAEVIETLAARQFYADHPNLQVPEYEEIRVPHPPESVNVTQVFTAGTPHAGMAGGWAGIQEIGCFLFDAFGKIESSRQCKDMKPDSATMRFLMRRKQNGQLANPATGSAGTDWTVVGSTKDETVHPASAIALPGAKVTVYDDVERLKVVGARLDIKHQVTFTTEPELYYFRDSGCRHTQVVFSDVCGTVPGMGFHCNNNLMKTNEKGYKDGLCKWKWQPGVNYHASKALSSGDW